MSFMRIAIVHEWFATYAGSERVVEQLLQLYPNADLFALVDSMSGKDRPAFLKDRTVKTSFIQRLPFGLKKFRGYLPLMPLAVEQFDLSGYDLIISSNHAVAKGIIRCARSASHQLCSHAHPLCVGHAGPIPSRVGSGKRAQKLVSAGDAPLCASVGSGGRQSR